MKHEALSIKFEKKRRILDCIHGIRSFTQEVQEIAIHLESGLRGNRKLVLYQDRVVIHGKVSGGPEYESTVDLKTLVPEPDWMSYRDPMFLYSLCMIGVGVFIPVVFIDHFWDQQWVPMTSLILLCLGLGGVTFTFRKFVVVRFKNETGLIALDIVKTSVGAVKMDEFVELVKRQIRQNRDDKESNPEA